MTQYQCLGGGTLLDALQYRCPTTSNNRRRLLCLRRHQDTDSQGGFPIREPPAIMPFSRRSKDIAKTSKDTRITIPSRTAGSRYSIVIVIVRGCGQDEVGVEGLALPYRRGKKRRTSNGNHVFPRISYEFSILQDRNSVQELAGWLFIL